jgi:hypothetical protein
MKYENLPTPIEAIKAFNQVVVPKPIEAFLAEFGNESEFSENTNLRGAIVDVINYAENQQADKILSRLSAIFTDYKNAGFENSAQVTKFIMTEIEQIVKV